ncbi:MAG: hypothetical protein JF627_06900 [Alphaproteobacteria bacterium]|nr:hypothetical protein [Alphaproteobacteria bacterium]
MQARRIAGAVVGAGTAVMLAINAPGQLSYDSVEQLANGRSGAYNSWHPPVMAWLLGLFDAVLPGTLLFLVFQSLLLLGALLTLLWLRPRNGWTALVTLAIILTPQWLMFQGQIWKDILCANAAIAGFVCLAVAARDGRKRWLVPAAVLLALAAAVRQNAIVLLPVAALVAACTVPSKRWLIGFCFLAVSVALGTGTSLWLVARADGGDGASAEVRLGQAYDLAGALWHDPTLALPSLAAEDPQFEKLLRRRSATLYTPLRNDPFAADPGINHELANAPEGAVGRAWTGLVTGHPLLYLRTRLAAFGAVLFTPDATACHFSHAGIDGPPALLHQLGLVAGVRPQDRMLLNYVKLFFATPIYSHIAWGLLALLALGLLLQRKGPGDLAIAGLLAGALLFTLTFAALSIACDYRYLILLDLAAMTGALHLAAGRKV